MADENKSMENNVTENPQANNEPAQNNGPTVEELMAQLAAARADADKYKSANDKLSKSEAEMKRQLRATLSADEQKKAEEEEARRIDAEEKEAMRKELNHIKAVAAYKDFDDEKVVESLIDAISDADHNAIANIIANERKKAATQKEAEMLKDRPRVQHGQYSSMTREQIMAISDRDERLKAIAMNQELFK